MNNELYHHGVKGMRWGVRKKRPTTGRHVRTRSGEQLYLQKRETPTFTKVLAKHNSKIRDTVNRTTQYKIMKGDKRVGDLELYSVSKDELNGVWLGINNNERGHGYASAVLEDTINYAKQNGYKKMTLEVPGHSPDARHIYEKHGFVPTKVLSTQEDDPVWSGLTAMELDLTQVKHIDDDTNYLVHHGVKGMKWGVRKERELVGRKRRSSTKSTRKRNATTREGAGLLKKKQSKKEVFPPYVNEQVVRQMNPTNNQMNCAFTSTGYVVNKITSKNVTANAFEPGMLGDLTANTGTSPDFFEKALSNTTRSKFSDAKYFRDLPTMTEATKNIKDNSYGIIFVQHPLGCGHYVNYEKRNGVTTIIDCQGTAFTGKQVNSPDAWSKKGVRAIEYWDCTNASISPEGQSKYLNKILRES